MITSSSLELKFQVKLSNRNELVKDLEIYNFIKKRSLEAARLHKLVPYQGSNNVTDESIYSTK